MVTHPTINRAQHGLTSLIETNALPLRQIAILATLQNKLPGHLVRSFVRSLRTGIQPTLDPSAETFILVQCASPGRERELVGVCGVCARCVGWRKVQ